MISAIKSILNAVETTANVINKSVILADNELEMLHKQQQLRAVELDHKLLVKAQSLGITL
jgi:hypothetical protein